MYGIHQWIMVALLSTKTEGKKNHTTESFNLCVTFLKGISNFPFQMFPDNFTIWSLFNLELFRSSQEHLAS